VTILLVAPRDNQAARRCGQWAERLDAQFPGAFTLCVPGSRQQLDEPLARHRHLFYFGHGERDALVTLRKLFRPRRDLVDRANAIGEEERIVVAVACWSGADLAPAVTDPSLRPRVRSYIGWDNRMQWPVGWPDPIGDALVRAIAVLMEKGTVGDCQREIEVAFAEAHQRYEDEGPRRLTAAHAGIAKMCAKYWISQLVVEGDLSATL
jgi:hypothetical protein